MQHLRKLRHPLLPFSGLSTHTTFPTSFRTAAHATNHRTFAHLAVCIACRNTLRGHFWCGGRWQPLPNPLKVMESTPIALQTLLLVCTMVDLMCMLLVMVRFWCIPKQSPGDICLQVSSWLRTGLIFSFVCIVYMPRISPSSCHSSRFSRNVTARHRDTYLCSFSHLPGSCLPFLVRCLRHQARGLLAFICVGYWCHS